MYLLSDHRDTFPQRKTERVVSCMMPCVLSIQKILSGSSCAGKLRSALWGNKFATTMLHDQNWTTSSDRAERLRLMGKYIGHRLVARSEPDNTFGTDSMSIFVFILQNQVRESDRPVGICLARSSTISPLGGGYSKCIAARGNLPDFSLE